MASNKRRKLDTSQGTQMMSAVALRRKLLQESSTAKSSTTTVKDDVPSSDAVDEVEVARESGRKRSEARQAQPGDGIDWKAVDDAVHKAKASANISAVVSRQGPRPQESDGEDFKERRVVQLSSFKPDKKNYQRKADGSVTLKLPDGERLAILGNYGIRVQEGEATIAGATLYPSDTIHWVSAPHCHALPVLRCSDDSILELHSHPAAAKLRKLERLSPVFCNLWNDDRSAGKGVRKAHAPPSFQILSTTADGPKRAILQDLRSPAEWNKKLADLVSPKRRPTKQARAPAVLVCGPKSSGKSTFSKLLTNRLVTDQAGTKKRTWSGVAVLDLDPGQPEFSPPGVISLVYITEPVLSPPFCHPTLPDRKNGPMKHRSHALAAVSPASRPEHYLECVLDLYSHYQNSLRGKAPLIINTPGWIQGTGLDLLSALISRIHPTEVIYMSETGPEDTVEQLRVACGNRASLTTLPSQPSEYTSRTALHLRTMQMMSYFHLDLASGRGEALAWEPSPLTTVPPVQLRYDGANPGLLGVICYGYKQDPELLADAINGTVLAIVEVDDKRALRGHSELAQSPRKLHHSDDIMDGDADAAARDDSFPREEKDSVDELIIRTPEGIPYIQSETPLDSRYSRTVGLALLRGVDTQRRVLQLLTPISPETMTNVQKDGKDIVLVAGSFDTPTWAYTEDRYHQSFGPGAGGGGGTAAAAAAEGREGSVDVTDEDTDEDESEGADEEVVAGSSEIPWTEVLHGNQKRAVGSRVWRVRRDLGRSANAAD
ncbi:Polynucleotide 5'-hydroxyl-kinase GRC3 [Pleurostoma richardsiae]|uniref:Polynucleotide 5'-hydroxyl-kinase GRC3 n=1 Tax=Pleurostoma richardsiae TaxID=41990 RepID=A0AA38RVA1_9PEZI|nr:Polynucleotide 5'-hydroxyl-kinase GRC3 [Pleurostoma richardsiae]